MGMGGSKPWRRSWTSDARTTTRTQGPMLTAGRCRSRSAAGGVNRAVCQADGDGWLETVEEVVDIRRTDDDTYAGTDAHGRPVQLSGDALVSMNLWVFTPAVFTVLRRGFAEFLRQGGAGAQGEFLISHGIRDAVRRGEAHGIPDRM